MTIEEHIENLKAIASDMPSDKCADWIESLMAGVKALEQVSSSEKPNKWIPVKWHEITDEEREREGYPKDWACYLDCIMPYDGQRILITTKGGFVELDECYSDDGCTFSLDSGYDWVDDVVAWMPLPQPYQPEIPTGTEGSEKND